MSDSQHKDDECYESTLDSVPIISQLKSAWELANGQPNCAKKTQEVFLEEGIGASQINSVFHLIQGDYESAEKIQEEFIEDIGEKIELVPVAGHVKAAVHCLNEEYDECKNVVIKATRPVVVSSGGILGGLAAGAVGAATGGITAGVAYDRVVTSVNNKYTPDEMAEKVKKIINNEASPGEQFETGYQLFIDGNQ